MSDTGMGRQRELAVSPEQVREYLKNMAFPATKEAILKHVRRQGASQGVQDAIDALPDVRYETPLDVMQALSGPA